LICPNLWLGSALPPQHFRENPVVPEHQDASIAGEAVGALIENDSCAASHFCAVYVNQFIHIPIPKHIVFMSELASSAFSFDVFVWCLGVATND